MPNKNDQKYQRSTRTCKVSKLYISFTYSLSSCTLLSKKNTTVNKSVFVLTENYIYVVFVKLQQIIFQNIITSSHLHINIILWYNQCFLLIGFNINSHVYFYYCLTFVRSKHMYENEYSLIM